MLTSLTRWILAHKRIVASFWISRTLQQFLYGVTPHDAVSFAAVALLLINLRSFFVRR